MPETPTCVAALTPPGRAALATVAVWGPQATAAVQGCFRSASSKSLDTTPVGRIAFGYWGAHAASGEEEVVLVRTASQAIEVHCHGGQTAVERIVDDLRQCGCRQQPWTDWLSWCQPDPLQQEAMRALADAPTTRCAAILLDQHRCGSLRRETETVLADLRRRSWSSATQRVQRLLQLGPLGLHLTVPWQVLVSGPPNAGKSSLINAVAGYRRSIVVEQPGTTRDLVRLNTALDGWPVELIDSAGIRATADPLEREAIARVEPLLRQVDLVLWVQELGRGGPWPEAQLGRPPDRLLTVWSKADLRPRPPKNATGSITSAATGMGLERLGKTIVEHLIPRLPGPGEPVPFARRQIEWLQCAQHALRQGRGPDAGRALEALLAGRQPPSADDS